MNRNEVDRQYTRSSGSGGQNVNRRSTCVQLTHKPTGMSVKCQDTRDQHKNEEIAWIRLEEKLKSIEEEKWNKKVYQNRLNQVGSGSRSDKKRSYRIKEDLVIDTKLENNVHSKTLAEENWNYYLNKKPSHMTGFLFLFLKVLNEFFVGFYDTTFCCNFRIFWIFRFLLYITRFWLYKVDFARC